MPFHGTDPGNFQVRYGPGGGGGANDYEGISAHHKQKVAYGQGPMRKLWVLHAL